MKNTPDKKLSKSKVGRPTVMTDDVVAKLEHAFAIGATATEACSYADISRNSLYDYIAYNEKFSNRIEQLRDKPILKAKNTIVKDLDQTGTAKWYLEKKSKEFAPQANVTAVQVNINEDRENFA